MPFPIRIAADTLPALIAGGLLLTYSIVSAWLHIQSRQAISEAFASDELTCRHADRQLRRRLQVSAMLGLIGVLIPLGDQLQNFFGARPGLFFLYWVGILILVAWAVMIALGDWMSSSVYSSLADIQLRAEELRLKEEVRRFRESQSADSSDHPATLE